MFERNDWSQSSVLYERDLHLDMRRMEFCEGILARGRRFSALVAPRSQASGCTGSDGRGAFEDADDCCCACSYVRGASTSPPPCSNAARYCAMMDVLRC
eukprot:m.1103646 g.1103646  ORF g.1103646 m.1103646 type:complete len:99 (+) comp24334_c0_seq1:222-518(+)